MGYKKKGYYEGQVCENRNCKYSNVGELYLGYQQSL